MPELGVIMTYEGGNMCNETHHYSLTVQLNCNSNIDVTTYALDKNSLSSPCDPRVIMNSPLACPVISTGALGQFMEDYRYWLAVPFILLGVYLFAAGGRNPEATLAIFATVFPALALMWTLYIWVLPNQTPSWTVWIVGIVCFGLGSGMGYASGRWPIVGIVLLGLSLGTVFGYGLQAVLL